MKKDLVVFTRSIMLAMKAVYGINFKKFKQNKNNPNFVVFYYEDNEENRNAINELSKTIIHK